MKPSLQRRMVAEFAGTLFLLAAVVGSGIMGERLAAGNVALALLANTIATGAALIALILAFGAISGAHLNPAVTLADALRGGFPWREVPAYILVQVAGAAVGVIVAHFMFGLPLLAISTHIRGGPSQLFSEFVATFGLLAVIWGCARHRSSAVPRCWFLYRRSLLVHRIHVVRQSCRDSRPLYDRYIFWYSPDRCRRFHRGANQRRGSCDASLSVARAYS
jgi:glycerol uptake facilitator-like aquaporin